MDKWSKLRYQNARDYGKLLKSTSQGPKSNKPLYKFERYFKAINTKIVHSMYWTMILLQQMTCISIGGRI